MKSILDISLYVGFVFLTLIAILMVPGSSDKLMIITPSKSTGTNIYGILDGTDARLISKVSDHRYIIENTGNKLVSQLYQNGAFLVLNAAPIYGCGAKEQPRSKADMAFAATLSEK
ncbi:hypothetical protein KFE96_15650 [Kordiimonas sp. SCSIO 12603]|uniref:hypothetical protein n=1 Tax=Kordiimonas sp. SCSIO 12603 TaxID=2829596 RepID=UPI0021072028|nr:hypothetical protein [Kordiimonas sp. SCSIO 12603]UTW58240.1 hypothetical protein KFE96_15650 [Kordiimonas sp. SCSIO 12603]